MLKQKISPLDKDSNREIRITSRMKQIFKI